MEKLMARIQKLADAIRDLNGQVLMLSSTLKNLKDIVDGEEE